MGTWSRRFSILGLTLALAMGAWADELVIESFDRSGQLTFRTLSSATDYRVEWACTPNGPWTNSWSMLNDIEVHPRQQQVTCSVPMCYRVVASVMPSNPPPLEGMVLIPGGMNAGTDPDFGPYILTVAPFYMDRCEVTKALWDDVKNWNGGNGYSYDNAGSGKAANHPVTDVNWCDCVKWCNARSEKEGRMPVYRLSLSDLERMLDGDDAEGCAQYQAPAGERVPPSNRMHGRRNRAMTR